MKHIYIVLLVVLFGVSASKAQSDTLPHVEKGQFTYHLLFGASYESGVGRLNTVRVSGPLDIGLLYEYSTTFGGSTEANSYFYLRPAVVGEFRHYYNLDKRQRKGKRVDKNSGNFIAPMVGIFGPAIIKSEGITTADFGGYAGAVWGMQRNYGKSFNLQLSIGPGIGFADGDISFVPLGGLSLGFRLGN